MSEIQQQNQQSTFFPGQFWVQSLGVQGPPGSLENVPATLIDYGPATSCIPQSINNLDAWMAWIEANIVCPLDPTALVASPNGSILTWDTATNTVVTKNLGSVLGDQVPGTTDDTILVFNTTTGTYQPKPLSDWISEDLPDLMGDILDDAFPCSPGQILTCGPTGWGVGTIPAALAAAVPGNTTFDVLAWDQGTGLYEPLPISLLISDLFSLPATPGDVLVVDPTGNGLQSADLCNEVYTCLGGVLGVGQLYYNDGSGPGPHDLSSIISGSVQPLLGLPGTPGDIVKVDSNGTGFTSGSLCTELYNCLGGPLSAGQIYYHNGAGSTPTDLGALIDQGITTALGLPGPPGGVLVVDAAGNGVDTLDISDFLNTQYPAGSSGQTCTPETLINTGAGWEVGKGTPSAPTAWAYPLAPSSHPLALQTDLNGCHTWGAKGHISGTYIVGGGGSDFPTLEDFVVWAGQHASVDVVLDIRSNQALFEPFHVAGRIELKTNNNRIQTLNHWNSNVSIVVQDNYQGEKIFVFGSANIRILGTLNLDGYSGDSNLTALGSGSIYVAGNVLIDGTNTVDAISARENGVIATDSNLIVSGATNNCVFAVSGGIIRVGGDLTASGGNNGVSIAVGSALYVEGNVSANNNAAFGLYILEGGDGNVFGDVTANNNNVGVICAWSGRLRVTGLITTNNNSTDGTYAVIDGSILADGGITAQDNGNNGIVSNSSSYIRIGGPALASDNNYGVVIIGHAHIACTNPLVTRDNTVGGFKVDTSSTFTINNGHLVTIQNNSLGIECASGGKLWFVSGFTSFIGNGSNSNLPFNTLSGEGSYIRI